MTVSHGHSEARRPNSLWMLISIPLVVVLSVISPVMNLLGVLLVGNIFASILFEISSVGPQFPFLRMMVISLGGLILLLLYRVLLVRLVH